MENSSNNKPNALAEKLAQQLQEVRANKVAALREKLSSGAYRVNSSKIAKSLFISPR